jgi:NAD(P)H-hydrate epimerase
MKILTSQQVRDVDRLTTEKFGIPQLTLMENAGTRVVEAIEDSVDDLKNRRVVVLCGKGNNGGDGFVVARQLIDKGCVPRVYLIGSVEDLAGDAAVNFARLGKMGYPPEVISSAVPDVSDAEIIVDAIVGTGLTRPLDGVHAAVIGGISRAADATVVSIDIPSGLVADRAEIIGPAVDADITVTFTALKPCLVFPPASKKAGDIRVVDIGSPEELVSVPEYQLTFITSDDFPEALHHRAEATHKGDYGRVLVVAGSRGKSGAAAMAGQAAMRAGAGLVTVATSESVAPVVAGAMLELMTEYLPETEAGTLANRSIAHLLEGKTVLAIGPGLGTHPETQALVRATVSASKVPVVIDADGLNAFVTHSAELHGDAGRPLVVTPHPGEMSRLIGRDSDYVNANRVAVARDFAVSRQVHVVLKGFRTVIAVPNGDVFINATGNPGMAKGGTGDILTGMIAGVLAQRGLGSFIERLCFAVYLHGLAGDLAADEMGEESLVATDLLRFVGEAWDHVRQ